MSAPVVSIGVAQYDQSDLEEMRSESLDLLTISLLGFVVGVLLVAAVDPEVRQPTIWLTLLPILAAAMLGRLRHLGVAGASGLLIVILGLTIVGARYAYADLRTIYFFPLLIIAANVLLGDGVSIIVTGALTLVTAAISDARSVLDLVHASGVALFLLWATAVLSVIATRPTRIALRWAWRSYALAQARTAELRDRQAELGRLTKSLSETCAHLERLNAELDRERRAAEEARRLKAEFAAAISHELRTPLNLIIGFSEMMTRAPHAYAGQPLPELYRHDLEAIQRNASHISRLIDDVLDLSQIDAHRLALEKRPASLSAIVDSAVLTVTSLYEHLGLTLSLELSEDLPVLIVDPDRIRQILINLLNNAARFTERGGVTIRASQRDDHVIISVADTGVGIAPTDLPHVFDEFRQVGPSGHFRGGSGLGLAVCRRFAEMHGGYMWAESRIGEGSTFYLALPLGDPAVVSPARLEGATHRTAERSVAVLSRDADTIRIFRRYLDGYRVIRVRSLAEAGRRVQEDPLHALILINPDRPVIGSSSNGHDLPHHMPIFSCILRTQRTIAEGLGVAQYLVKPVSRDRFLAALRRVAKDARDILIVEDDSDLARLLASFIRATSLHAVVHVASDGTEALAQMRMQRPDVVVLDLLLPSTDGFGVLKAMRANPALRDVPVIVVSAKGLNEEEVRSASLELTRPDGLTVGEMVKCLRSSLDVLLGGVPVDTSAAQPANWPQ